MLRRRLSFSTSSGGLVKSGTNARSFLLALKKMDRTASVSMTIQTKRSNPNVRKEIAFQTMAIVSGNKTSGALKREMSVQ
jgi:hypothetical protein